MTAQVKAQAAKQAAVCAYRDGFEHMADELDRLDLLIARRALTFRAEMHDGCAPDARAKALFVGDTEVDGLLAGDVRRDAAGIAQKLTELNAKIAASVRLIEQSVAVSLEQSTPLPLISLRHIFNLSDFEYDTIVICLAPELRRKYDRLYAYLQDDITRKKPSVDLVLELLVPVESERWRARALLSGNGALRRSRLLETASDPHSPSGSAGLGEFIKLPSRILAFLNGDHSIDVGLQSALSWLIASSDTESVAVAGDSKARLMQRTRDFIDGAATRKTSLIVHLSGVEGSGKKTLAAAVLRDQDCRGICVDLQRLAGGIPNAEEFLRCAFRESLLQQASLYFDRVDALTDDTANGGVLENTLLALLRQYRCLVFLSGTKRWRTTASLRGIDFYQESIRRPDARQRESVWRQCLGDDLSEFDGNSIIRVAQQFELTPRQISQAASGLLSDRQAFARQPGESEILNACREVSNHGLSSLATLVPDRYAWDDIVLPDNTVWQLRAICNQVRQQNRVLCDWGFADKLGCRRGVSALFSGNSGTGKTMAAQVIAGELEMDLYRIDLASVVSKYIGETEKNLGRIFDEAETSNSIIVFDECDALFGKRTDISDSHDRYANIEVSYLLQKMEDYAGTVILTTNLRKNIDDAFLRRIQFITEFPFPDKGSRARIWQGHLPKQAPVSDEIDFSFLAAQFRLAGANIRNIVINAAYLAAGAGAQITMEHIVSAIRVEYEKVGKLWRDQDIAELAQYRDAD